MRENQVEPVILLVHRRYVIHLLIASWSLFV